MATNPNRPQYQDTIESTWGQSVADHVIRRYASPAERDADLADVLDVEGQIVEIIPGGGMRPYLMRCELGRWWRFPRFDTRGSTDFRTTDGNGFWNSPPPVFTEPFDPKDLLVTTLSVILSASYNDFMRGQIYGISTTGFSLICMSRYGTPIANAGVQLTWTATAIYKAEGTLARDYGIEGPTLGDLAPGTFLVDEYDPNGPHPRELIVETKRGERA